MKHKGNKNLTWTQRLQIETLFNAKCKVKDISKQLGLHISTIYYELKRGAYEHTIKQDSFWYGTRYKKEIRYSAQIAYDKYKLLCTAKGRPLKIGNDYALINYINDKVKKEKISATAVLGQIKHLNLKFNTTISKTTLYRYIELGFFDNIKIQKRKEKYRKTCIKKAPKGTSIEKRPNEINSRLTFGHWEMDCVCGSNKATFLVLSERLTRKEIIYKMENQKSESVIKCLNNLERKFGKKFKIIFKSITMDNGSEFSNWEGIEQSVYGGKRTTTYYCHPYCSCERGTNERLNREIRRLVPKGSELSKYTNKDVKQIENWLNNYPRIVLNFATANELFEKQLKNIA